MKEKKKILGLSFSKKIMLITLVIILLLALLISFSSWRLSSSAFSTLELKLLTQNTDSIYSQLRTSLENTQNLTTQIVHSDALAEIIEMEDRGSGNLGFHTHQLSKTIDSIIYSSSASKTSSIQFINIYLKDGYSCNSVNPEYLPYSNYYDCYDALLALNPSSLDDYTPTTWFDATTIQPLGTTSSCIIGVRFLYENITLEKIGVIVIGIRQTSLQAIYSNLPLDSYIIRSDGKLLSYSRAADISQPFVDKEWITANLKDSSMQKIVTLNNGKRSFVYRLAGGEAWLFIPINEKLITNSEAVHTYTVQVTSITIFSLITVTLLGWFFSRTLTSSLVRLKTVVQRVYNGELSARFHSKQRDEIAYLGSKFNDMLEQVEAFYQMQEQDAAEKRNLELQLMQSQINPHLLYNTLNSVIGIIRKKDMQKAEYLIISLGGFFKLALSKGNECIRLSEEIAMIQYYLKVQNLGRSKSFVMHEDIPESLKNQSILRLILQPLVENSVIHGFTDWRDDGVITISANEDIAKGICRITVTDNGVGILPEDLKELLEDIKSYPPKKEHKHYGLYNIERRIKNKYGREFGLYVVSEVGNFTKITLEIPLCKETSDD